MSEYKASINLCMRWESNRYLLELNLYPWGPTMMMGEARPPSTSTAFMLPKGTVTKIIQTKSRVADPDPGSGAFFTPGSGIRVGKRSVSGIRDPG